MFISVEMISTPFQVHGGVRKIKLLNSFSWQVLIQPKVHCQMHKQVQHKVIVGIIVFGFIFGENDDHTTLLFFFFFVLFLFC